MKTIKWKKEAKKKVAATFKGKGLKPIKREKKSSTKVY